MHNLYLNVQSWLKNVSMYKYWEIKNKEKANKINKPGELLYAFWQRQVAHAVVDD